MGHQTSLSLTKNRRVTTPACGVEWSGYVGRIPCSSKASKSTPQDSQPAFSTSESALAYLFERECFVDSFWGALWPDVRPFWDEMKASKSKCPLYEVVGAPP